MTDIKDMKIILTHSELYNDIIEENTTDEEITDFYNALVKRFKLNETKLHDIIVNDSISPITMDNYTIIFEALYFYRFQNFEKLRIIFIAEELANGNIFGEMKQSKNKDLRDEFFRDSCINRWGRHVTDVYSKNGVPHGILVDAIDSGSLITLLYFRNSKIYEYREKVRDKFHKIFEKRYLAAIIGRKNKDKDIKDIRVTDNDDNIMNHFSVDQLIAFSKS